MKSHLRYPQGKIARMAELNAQIAKLESEKAVLATNMFDDLVDDWGKSLKDYEEFSLLACNGFYDADDVALYKKFCDEAQRFRGEIACLFMFNIAERYQSIDFGFSAYFFRLRGDYHFDMNDVSLTLGVKDDIAVCYDETPNVEQQGFTREMRILPQPRIAMHPFANRYDANTRPVLTSFSLSTHVDNRDRMQCGWAFGELAASRLFIDRFTGHREVFRKALYYLNAPRIGSGNAKVSHL